MYAEDYRDESLAREDYAALGEGAAACAGCQAPRCLAACPFGLPVPTLTGRTHRRLAGGSGS